MDKRNLGASRLPVTVLGFGAMELRHLAQGDAIRMVNAVLDLGINYIDSSPDYGLSEEYIGKAVAHRRAEFFLASKCGCNVDAAGKGQTPPHLWTRAQLLWNIENSLRLLKTDHLDVWQLHGTLPTELAGGAADEVIRTLQEVKQQGKVRSIGLSFKNGGAGDPLYPDGYTFAYMKHFLELGVFDLFQVVYGGMVRRNELAITRAAALGLGIVARGVVKHYGSDFSERFASAGLPDLCAPAESMSQFLLRFALNHSGISTLIIGTKNQEHLAENIRAADAGPLPAAVYQEACQRLAVMGSVPQEI